MLSEYLDSVNHTVSRVQGTGEHCMFTCGRQQAVAAHVAERMNDRGLASVASTVDPPAPFTGGQIKMQLERRLAALPTIESGGGPQVSDMERSNIAQLWRLHAIRAREHQVRA